MRGRRCWRAAGGPPLYHVLPAFSGSETLAVLYCIEGINMNSPCLCEGQATTRDGTCLELNLSVQQGETAARRRFSLGPLGNVVLKGRTHVHIWRRGGFGEGEQERNAAPGRQSRLLPCAMRPAPHRHRASGGKQETFGGRPRVQKTGSGRARAEFQRSATWSAQRGST